MGVAPGYRARDHQPLHLTVGMRTQYGIPQEPAMGIVSREAQVLAWVLVHGSGS